MTVVLVSRPLVLGEDPSFSSDFSYFDPVTLILSLLTLATAAAWAGWRLWSKESAWYAGIVEFGLLLIVVGSFASIPIASNKHAAWLVSWEWLVLLVGFSTLRQLAVTRAELQGFLTALLATVVALSFYASYQSAIEIPADLIRMNEEDAAARTAQAEGAFALIDPDSPARIAQRERVEDAHAFGTYAHPNSFAGYLVLFIPALFGAAWLARYKGRPYPQRMWLLFFAVVAVIALYLTHSRGGMLGLLGASVLVAGFAARGWLAKNPLYILVSLIGVVVLGYAVLQFGTLTKALNKNTETMAVRLEYWSATARMLADRPWLGVGAGNFGTAYTKYMAAASAEKIKDPHNLFLDLWANAGLLGLVGLILVVFGFLWKQLPHTRDPEALLEEKALTAEEQAAEPDVRWEFYVGGAIGLILAFALKALGQPQQLVITEGIVASVRTVIWFLAFALLEQVAWPPRLRSLLLTGGVLALLGNLFVSGGIGFPSVSFLLLAAMALALNSPLPRRVALVEKYGKVAKAVPFPALFALFLVYLSGVFYPSAHAAALTINVRQYAQDYERDQHLVPVASQRRWLNREFPTNNQQSVNPAYNRVFEHMVKPLTTASDLERWDPRLPAEVAQWSQRLWEMRPTQEGLGKKVVAWATETQKRDPASILGYRTEADLREKFAQFLEGSQDARLFAGNAFRVFVEERGPLKGGGSRRKDIREQYTLAAQALERFQPNDPTDAPLAYRIAELYARADDVPNMTKWGELALKLDLSAKGRLRSLSDPQRTQLRRWLGVEEGR